jgi:hypothetical protein
MSMIVSARGAPDWESSIDSPVRASEPSTRIVLPVSRLPSVDRARSALSDTPSWSCAEIMKIATESRIQPSTAIATHFTTRPGLTPLRSRGSRSRRRPSRFRRPSRSPDGRRLPSGRRRER